MILINTETGERYNGKIEKVGQEELKQLKGNLDFTFDWSKEDKSEVYKIRLKNEDEILGLISLIDVPAEFRIHINLIESAKKHRGRNKKIKNIPDCLISYVCKLSFERGYDGFVSLVPKTELIDYYRDNFGFIEVGAHMAIFMEKSKSLILKYIGNEEI